MEGLAQPDHEPITLQSSKNRGANIRDEPNAGMERQAESWTKAREAPTSTLVVGWVIAWLDPMVLLGCRFPFKLVRRSLLLPMVTMSVYAGREVREGS